MTRKFEIIVLFVLIISIIIFSQSVHAAINNTRLIEQNFTGYVTSPYTITTNGSWLAGLEAWHMADTLQGASNSGDGSLESSGVTGPGSWTSFDLGPGNATQLNSYNVSIWLYNGSRAFDPASWKIEASNDNTTWALLDWTNTSTWSNGEAPRKFNFSNNIAYRWYRFTLWSTFQPANNTVNGFGLGELMWLRNNVTNPVITPYLSFAVQETRGSTQIQTFNYAYVTTNASDVGPFTGYCTGAICQITNYTGIVNATFTNISGGTYFNTSTNNINFTTTTTSTGLTWQNYLNLTLNNSVNSSSIRTFNVNVSNGTATNFLSTTSNSIIFYNVIGNLTVLYWNISGNTYFNVSQTLLSFNTTMNLTNVTNQGTINLNVYQLFTNNSIGTFNATNNNAYNTTSTNALTIAANNGSNNILIGVPGNYSQNITCSLSTPVSTSYCNATNIYDDQFTIGGTFSGSGINIFSVNVTNTTLGGIIYSTSTTNGSIVFSLLQGHYYNFFMNPTGYSLANITLPANASTNIYNFSIQQYNSFEFHFYNETTNTQLNGSNISIQIISSSYSANYTTSNGTILITLLTPASYTIQYYTDPIVPRNYYYTLTNQSYNNVTLYVLDAGISTIYLPVVVDQNTAPLSGATIQLLRAYIVNNQYVYYPVEMTQTDTNGQGVLRVVPNTIYYKLFITNNGFTVTTTPTKLTTSTNTYTLSQQSSPLTSIIGMPNVAKSLTYNNATNTYTFTWSDTTNLVTSGCMIVTENKNTATSTPYNQCSNGATGSLTYTISDTNNTRYYASATLTTNTLYSNYGFGPVSVDFTTTPQTWGRLGMLLLLIVLLAVGFMVNESGSDGMIIGSMVIMLFFGVVGIISYAWEAFVPIFIFAGIIIYKTRR